MGEIITPLLFKLTLSGSIGTLLMLGVLPIAKKHFKAVWIYRMWIGILLVFIIPSPISIPITGTVQKNLEQLIGSKQYKEQINKALDQKIKYKLFEQAENTHQESTLINKRDKDVTNKQLVNKEFIDKEMISNNPINRKQNHMEPIKRNFIRVNILGLIWFSGFSVVIIGAIRSYKRVYTRLLRSSKLAKDTSLLNLYQKITSAKGVRKNPILRISKQTDTPMLIGIKRPMLVLPEIHELDEEALAYVLTHELVHYRRKDVAIKWLCLVLRAVHWFNPLAYSVIYSIHKFSELACDEEVVKELTKHERKKYIQTILLLIETTIFEKSTLSTCMCESKKQLKGRLSEIMKIKHFAKRSKYIAIFIGAFISGSALCFASAKRQVQKHPLEQSIERENLDTVHPKELEELFNTTAKNYPRYTGRKEQLQAGQIHIYETKKEHIGGEIYNLFLREYNQQHKVISCQVYEVTKYTVKCMATTQIEEVLIPYVTKDILPREKELEIITCKITDTKKRKDKFYVNVMVDYKMQKTGQITRIYTQIAFERNENGTYQRPMEVSGIRYSQIIKTPNTM